MAMQSALERYDDIDYTFSSSREGKFVKVWKLSAAIAIAAHMTKYTYCNLSCHAAMSQISLVCIIWERCALQDLVEAFEAGDAERYTDAIAEYDSMTRLDAWKTTLLLRGKKRLQSNDEQDEPDLT